MTLGSLAFPFVSALVSSWLIMNKGAYSGYSSANALNSFVKIRSEHLAEGSRK